MKILYVHNEYEKILAVLNGILGDTIRIEISYVRCLDQTLAGKHRYITSDIGYAL